MSEPDVTLRYPSFTAELVIQGPQGPPGATGGTAVFPYEYRGGAAGMDPGAGGITIQTTTGQGRILAVSKTDADGGARRPQMLLTGDAVTVADAPGGSVTGFARYLLTADPVDMGAWASLTAVRTDVVGAPAPPPVGTRVNVYGSFSGAGELYAARDDVWAAGVTTPAPIITAHDPATGRLAIAGKEFGDTGWRDLNGELLNGWQQTAGSRFYGPFIRRIGYAVYLVLSTYNYLDGRTATDQTFLPQYVGFRQFPNSNYGPALFPVWNRANELIGIGNGVQVVGLRLPNGTAAEYRGNLVWLTRDAWPATLPGAPGPVADEPELLPG